MGIPEEGRRLRTVLRRMPPKLLHVLCEKYEVVTPDDITEYTLPDFIVQELSQAQRIDLLSCYAYAGRVVCNYLVAKKKLDPFDALVSTLGAIPTSPEKMDNPEQDTPLFEYSEIDEVNNLIRLRFRYFREVHSIYDPETSSVKDLYPLYGGTVIVRPNRRLLEVRASHREAARRMA